MPQEKARSGANAKRTRRLSSKSKLEEIEPEFVNMVFEDFRKHGASVIAAVREKDPAYYIKLCAATVPRGLKEPIDPIETMTDDELIARARQLAARLGIELGPNARGAARKKRPKQA